MLLILQTLAVLVLLVLVVPILIYFYSACYHLGRHRAADLFINLKRRKDKYHGNSPIEEK